MGSDGGGLDVNGIGWAVKQMQEGQKVARRGWCGAMWLALVQPSMKLNLVLAEDVGFLKGLKLAVPFVVMFTAAGELVPWPCSQSDLLATDWIQVSSVDETRGGEEMVT